MGAWVIVEVNNRLDKQTNYKAYSFYTVDMSCPCQKRNIPYTIVTGGAICYQFESTKSGFSKML